MTLFVYTCPICNHTIVSYAISKALKYAKQHLERVHHLQVTVAD